MNDYLSRVMKRSGAGLGGEMGQESMMNASMTPEIDFTKKTLSEQMIETPRKFEDVGGTDVAKEAPSSPSSSPSPMDYKSGGVSAAKSLSEGGSGTDALATGLVATGNPYAIGAGLTLATISSGQKKKEKRRMQEYEQAVAHANQRRASFENLANINQRMTV